VSDLPEPRGLLCWSPNDDDVENVDLDPLFLGLVLRLPKMGAKWSTEARDAWQMMFEAIADELHPESNPYLPCHNRATGSPQNLLWKVPMSQLSDTDLAAGSAPFWTVYCWNAEHTRRKIFRSYASAEEAMSAVVALRSHSIEAESVKVGDAEA
jgi:hypothetical protein